MLLLLFGGVLTADTVGYITSSTEALYAVTHSTELVYSAAVSIEGDEGP
jgi:hypothetical protein